MAYDDNILSTIKQLVGVEETYDAFDGDIRSSINTVFVTLHQLGVGPEKPFVLRTGDETWDDFIPPDKRPESLITFIQLQVRLLFDPPSTSYVIQSYERQIAELAQRLMMFEEQETVGDDDDG